MDKHIGKVGGNNAKRIIDMKPAAHPAPGGAASGKP